MNVHVFCRGLVGLVDDPLVDFDCAVQGGVVFVE